MRRPAMPLDLRASATGLAVVLLATPVHAQMWAGLGPRGVALPAATPSTPAMPGAPAQPSTPAAQPVSATPASVSSAVLSVASAASPARILRHLPAPIDGWQVSGETGALRWPLYLTPAQSASPTRLKVGYTSAISVLPESSTLRLKVNGRVIGSEAIDAAQGLRRASFAVPSEVLKPGFNEIAIDVEQRHRVDCSVAATYELWTRIEPADTGLEIAADTASPTALVDLPALAMRPDGTTPIHIVLAGRTTPAHIARLVRATQALALRARLQQPSVEFVQDSPEPYGVDLVLGTREALAKLPRMAGHLDSAGPRVALLPARNGERPLVLVTGSDDRQVDTALAALAERPALSGSEAGLIAVANFPAQPVQGGEALKLHALGVDTREFNGRFFRRSFAFSLPADTLAADYGRGTLDFAGSYAAGLNRDAQIRVDINGRNTGIIKMPRAAGGPIDHDQLFLPLGMMRPGLNRVDIYAETPRAADATCSAGGAKRFALLDTSTLRLPTLARVQRLPNLAATTAGALPYTDGGSLLVVPKPDRDSMAAALSLTARAAVAADHVVPFEFATRMPAEAAGSTLVVAPAPALDPAAMARVGLEPGTVEAAWNNPAAAKPAHVDPSADLVGDRWWKTTRDGPAACKLPHHDPDLGRAGPPADSYADDAILDWVTGEASSPSWRERIGSWAEAIRVKLLGRAAEGGAPGLTADTSLVLAQGVSDRSGHVTTIVTAPDAATLKASVACLFDPLVWTKVHGRLAALDAASGKVVSTDATRYVYRGLGGASPANNRLVMAGWFSLNPLAFVAAAILLALALSGSTLWFVRGVGRRPE